MSNPALITAYGFFLANYLFGISVKIGLIRKRGFRPVHHVLYFLVMLSLGVATIFAFVEGIEREPILNCALILLFLLLLAMPRFKGRSRGHWLYATTCFAIYSLLLFL